MHFYNKVTSQGHYNVVIKSNITHLRDKEFFIIKRFIRVVSQVYSSGIAEAEIRNIDADNIVQDTKDRFWNREMLYVARKDDGLVWGETKSSEHVAGGDRVRQGKLEVQSFYVGGKFA